jgi:CrcB protein
VTALLVAVGAAVGAPLRYLVDRAVQARHGSAFPWGTFAVNVAGSFLLGLLAAGSSAGAVSGGAMSLLGTGLCGALTTYSTFGYETVRLLTAETRFIAVVNALTSVVGGLGAAVCGAAVAQALWG